MITSDRGAVRLLRLDCFGVLVVGVGGLSCISVGSPGGSSGETAGEGDGDGGKEDRGEGGGDRSNSGRFVSSDSISTSIEMQGAGGGIAAGLGWFCG